MDPFADYGTADAGCWQVNLQNVGGTEGREPAVRRPLYAQGAGKYPAS
jgi:hypothetical protein